MSRWSKTDKWKFGKQDSSSASDKGPLEFSDLDPVDLQEHLGAGPLTPPPGGGPRIFDKYDEDEIKSMLDEAGVFRGLRAKGYESFTVELQYLDKLDQRIFIHYGKEILIHLRLKVSDFRFKLHAGEPRYRLMYIDWLMTRHPKAADLREERLFPGQDVPGLGIFSETVDFMSKLADGIGAQGTINLPEFFHDALLFHRFCKFYDPAKEIMFRGLIRDLRKIGARRISNALSDGLIKNEKDEVVGWSTGEMISPSTDSLRDLLWNDEYNRQVEKGLGSVKFRMSEPG